MKLLKWLMLLGVVFVLACLVPGASAAGTAQAAGNVYLDDRSTPQSLMESWANAINRHEFLRVYSYWQVGAAPTRWYPQFAAGYANTASVNLVMGTITLDIGAGQIYYSVPVTLLAKTTTGRDQTYVGCYILHLSQPGIQGVPPFAPLAIRSARVRQLPNGTNTTPLMAQACQQVGQPIPPEPTPDPSNITSSRYLDDRSDAVQVLRSLFNAVNRQEYVRAYWYWEPGAVGLAPYSKFAQGYAGTAAVQLVTANVQSEGAAGQFYYKVPVTLIARTTGGATQTFVGCYVLHQANPSVQGTPPFQPIGIRSATVAQVQAGADTNALMNQACQ